MNNEARKNYASESLNINFKYLIGHDNPSLWTAIQTIGDQVFIATFIEHNSNGDQPQKRVQRVTKVLQDRLGN